MQALLNINKGEKPYKMAVSDWLRDEDGAVMFRIISKKRLDGQIEFVYYTLRSDGKKRVIQHISFAEKDFWAIFDAAEDSLKPFFPNFKFTSQNIDLNEPEGFRTVKNNRINILKLHVISWIECKYQSFKTLVRKN